MEKNFIKFRVKNTLIVRTKFFITVIKIYFSLNFNIIGNREHITKFDPEPMPQIKHLKKHSEIIYFKL